MWADVPSQRQKFYANATFVSVYIDVSAPDLTSLRSGALVERVVEEQLDGTNAAIRAVLQTRLSDFQTEITNLNSWTKYGSTWDGTSWVAAGAA
jgi:hypothetical protein